MHKTALCTPSGSGFMCSQYSKQKNDKKRKEKCAKLTAKAVGNTGIHQMVSALLSTLTTGYVYTHCNEMVRLPCYYSYNDVALRKKERKKKEGKKSFMNYSFLTL